MAVNPNHRPGGLTMILHHEFIKVAKKQGKKLAVRDRTTGRDVTYDRALIGSLILSRRFIKIKGEFIGLMIPTSAGSFLTTLGVNMAGKTPVMINYSTGAAENCEYAQNKCGFKTIVTSRALCEKIGCRIVPGMIFIEDILASVKITEKLSAALRSKLPPKFIIRSLPEVDPEDTVVILFTSGSEKEPKGVMLTHRNISFDTTAISTAFQFTSDDIALCNLPVFHSFGYNVNFWLPLLHGMTSVTVANPLEYKTIPRIVREEKATLMAATPAFFTGYLRESSPGDFESIRILISGADKCPESLRDAYRKKHNIELLEGYGATETSPVASTTRLEANKPGSIGIPLPGVQMRIADLQTDETLPPGEEGKILVKGDLIMKGYFNDLEETSLRIHDGWYDTGDMGMMDSDGFFWHRGRLKRFVKIGGEMVSLVRTEIALESVLPEGVECCVVDIPDEVRGAKIVTALTSKINEKEVMKKLRGLLPAIALPKQFVVIGDLPKMGSGKTDFRTIAEIVRK